jgi:para-nitrobenzyl esterase
MRFHHLWLALTILPAFPGLAKPAPSSGPVAHLASGTVQGRSQGDIAVFEGIPFAAPPVGPLRWREPQPVTNWSGIREATKPSHPCIQNVQGLNTFLAPLATAYHAAYTPETVDPSEDCLYLNVWTPEKAVHLPVMVWVHGGSNRVGSGTETGYDGAILASYGVIVVTVNYRLGVMGFFSHPELTAESPHNSSGNYGLLDQIAALKWVQQNIAQFGGDPGNVTLFGESAGSVDAMILMTSPLSKGLFRKVIAESGPGFGLGPVRSVSDMAALGDAVGKTAGGPPGSQLQALRQIPAAQVAQIEDRLIATQFKGNNPNAPIVDGWVLPLSPAHAFASGAIQKVDLMAGFNAREWSAFRIGAEAATKSSGNAPPKPSVSDLFKQTADRTRPLYGNWTDLMIVTYMARMMVGGAAAVDQTTSDTMFACPIGAEAALTASAGQHAYVYRFDRSVPGPGESDLGAFHSLELPYVFGTFGAPFFNWLPFNATDHKLSRVMQTYWTNFAKSGNPNGPGLPNWADWNADGEPYLSFGENGDAIPSQGFSPLYCHLSADRLKEVLTAN